MEATVPPTRNLQKPLRQTASSTMGQTAEARTTTLQPAERKPQSQKIRQNEMAEKHVPDEGTR